MTMKPYNGVLLFPKKITNFFSSYMTLRMNMKGKHVLVIGTENPWLEALILEGGAEKVTTLGNTGSNLSTLM